MRNEVCICSLIPSIRNKTPVTVIMHHREFHKTTNTARIACLALQNSEIRLHGLKDKTQVLREQKILTEPSYQPILLTLNERSEVLTPEFVRRLDRPPHLIVPDGNWRQAGKMGKRITDLQNIPWVKLPPGPQSRYRLRHEHDPQGLSTLEAMARALGLIENSAIQVQLEQIFEIMVDRTLSTRPKIADKSSEWVGKN